METELFENSPEYFKNKFSNNCKMRLRYLSKLKNYFFNAENVLQQYMELERQKDPYCSFSDSFKNIYDLIMDIYENKLDELKIQVEQELNDELSKDFSKIIEENKLKRKS